MALSTRPVSIDGIEFSALIDSEETLSASSPSYVTEKNFNVSDSIILEPLQLSMTLFLTPIAITWKKFNSPTRVHDVLKRLEDLYFEKKIVTVVTSEKTYPQMVMTSITISKTSDLGTSREIPITFQQVRVAETSLTTIPDSYGRSGKTGANAGVANTTSGKAGSEPKPEDGNKGSILYHVGSAAGLYGDNKGGGLVGAVSGLFGGG